MNNVMPINLKMQIKMDKFPGKYKLLKLTQKEVQRSEQFSIYLESEIKPKIMSSQ